MGQKNKKTNQNCDEMGWEESYEKEKQGKFGR